MIDDDRIIVDSKGFFSIKNMPTHEEISRFYGEIYFQNEESRAKNYQDSYDEMELRYMDLINNLYLYSILKKRPDWENSKHSLLEIGAGEGFMLSLAQSRGWDITGIDFGDYAIKKFNPHILDKILIGNSLDLIKKFKEEKKTFDACMLHNVLEHVIEPRQLLGNLSQIISENGVVMITIPNDFSELQERALELGHIQDKFWIIPPQHLHYFNTENIKPFLSEMGFRVIDMYSSFPIDFFLFHPGSNYITQKQNGKLAHRARLELGLMMANSGLDAFHNLCQAFSKCKVGRDITIIAEHA